MARLIHLARASTVRSIERNGIRGARTSFLGPDQNRIELKKAVFAMPYLRDFSSAHQWLRELRRWHDERMVAVSFRFENDEAVWVGRYNQSHALLPLAASIQRLATSPLGQELIVPHSVARRNLVAVRDITQLVGWVETPEGENRFNCVCPACLPVGSRDLMRRVRGSFDRLLTEARDAKSATDTANALSKMDTTLERAAGRIPAKKLLSFAENPNSQIRKVATGLLSYFRWSDVEKVLAKRITDDHLDVRLAALRAMVRCGGFRRTYARLHNPTEELLLPLLDELEYPRSTHDAIWVLDAMSGKHSANVQRRIEVVRQLLLDENP